MPLDVQAPLGGEPLGKLEWSTLESNSPREVTEAVNSSLWTMSQACFTRGCMVGLLLSNLHIPQD